MKMNKYDIYVGNLNPPKGRAQAGFRPCVILQSNAISCHTTTMIVVPLTSNLRPRCPSEFVVQPSSCNGLSQPSRFLGWQITTVDRKFLGKKIGSLEPVYYPLVQEAIDIAMDAEGLF